MISRGIIGFFVGLLALSVMPQATQAHIGGLPFFKTNGVYSGIYTVPSLSTPDLPVPQDLATGTYTAGEEVSFEIDTKILQIPGSVVQATNFDWDFGDGSQGTGTTNTHTYTKAGPYIININSSPSNDPSAKQLIESLLINILPDKNYKLPRADFTVNGQSPADPNVAIVTFQINQETKFSAANSKTGSSPLVSYQWNFGDGSSITSGQQANHQYTAEHRFAAPFVRVTDQQGFYSDFGAELQDTSTDDSTVTSTKTPPNLPLSGEATTQPSPSLIREGGVGFSTSWTRWVFVGGIGIVIVVGSLLAIGRRHS